MPLQPELGHLFVGSPLTHGRQLQKLVILYGIPSLDVTKLAIAPHKNYTIASPLMKAGYRRAIALFIQKLLIK